MKSINVKKIKLVTFLALPLIAVIFILTFIFLPVKFLKTAEENAAKEKNEEINRLIDIDLLKFL